MACKPSCLASVREKFHSTEVRAQSVKFLINFMGQIALNADPQHSGGGVVIF